jgi:uncharacterized protein YbgA (DUF1722 family)
MDRIKPKVLLSSCQDSSYEYKNDIVKSAYVQKMMKYIDFVSFCPEERILGEETNEELRIIRKTSDGHHLLGKDSGVDYSKHVVSLGKEIQKEYKADQIDGFLFKSKRALTGVKRAKVYRNLEKNTIVTSYHKGFLTKEIEEHYPLHVVVSERMLRDEFDRDVFLINIFTRARFRACTSMACLHKFHSDNQYLFMVFNQSAYRRMGQILRNPAKYPYNKVRKQYEQELFKSLKKYVSVNRSAKMLDQLYTNFKKDLKLRERMHFNDLLKKYKEGKVSLSVVLELLKSYVVRFENDYLLSQTIFEPFPWELNRY